MPTTGLFEGDEKVASPAALEREKALGAFFSVGSIIAFSFSWNV